MKLEFLARFSKDLDRIGDEQIKQKLLKIINEVEISNKLSDIKNVKKIKGYKAAYRIKLGDYRIGFFFEEGVVQFARIINRKDIYKLFP